MSALNGYVEVNVILETGFSNINCTIEFPLSTKQKGKKLVDSNHVIRVREIRKSEITVIEGFCIRQTTVTASPYHVQIDIDHNRNVLDLHCSCVTKLRKRCKHIYALLHYIQCHRSSSKTSAEQEWGKPSVSQLSKLKYAKGKKCSELFPQKINLDEDKLIYFSPEDFAGINCAARNVILLESEPSIEKEKKAANRRALEERNMSFERECTLACVEYFTQSYCSTQLYGEEFVFCNDLQKTFYRQNVSLPEQEIIELSYRTIYQSQCPEWTTSRRLRITASSKAHRIKQLKRKSENILAQEFLTSRVVQNKNVLYGLQKERVAIKEYQERFEVEVVKVGLFIAPWQPWLGASVDGVVIIDGCVVKLLGIKCPISCKTKPIYDEINKKVNVSYLYINDGVIQLKCGHMYYTQVQMQMYCTGMTVCDMYVWSPKGSCRVEVHRDDSFLALLIPKLTTFYFSFYLPALCNEDKENYENKIVM